ncbi:MAG: phage holin family protein, partial [Oscillospiraceae bacterium]|nr:phage holin family protein [Oscillospiraceae bacterium]
MGVDYITGIIKAIYDKKLNSKIGAMGIVKKIGYLVLVGVAAQIDNIMGQTGVIRTMVIYFFVANEGLSIVENWAGMGLPIPKKLKDVLEQLKS